MQGFIARHNIERFRRQLAEARDPATRAMLTWLIAEEEEQLLRYEASQAAAGEQPQGLANAADGPAGAHARIAGIVEQLQLEPEPAQRHSLRRKLIEEEDRFGALAQRLDLVDGYIEDGARRIQTLEQLVARSQASGLSAQLHVSNLNHSREILEIFKSYRATVAERLDRTGL